MGDAVRYRIRSGLRSGWPARLAIVVLVGLAGGAVMTAVAAARRTDSAFDRMVVENRTADALINPDKGILSALTMSTIESLPSVARAGRVDGALALPAKATSIAELDAAPALMIPSDGDTTAFNRMRVDSGRAPDPSKPDEVFLARWYAELHHLKVGDRIPVRAVTPAQFQHQPSVTSDAGVAAALDATGTPVSMRVVGIGGGADSVSFDQSYEPMPWLGTPAFWEKYQHPSAQFWASDVLLKPGHTVEDLRAELAKAFPHEEISVQSLDGIRSQVHRAVAPQVVALWAFCAVAALVGLLVIGQALARRLGAEAGDNLTLDAMGMTHRDRFRVALVDVLVIGLLGGAVALLTAWLLSPLSPIGVARLAEPDPGFRADGWVLALGGFGLVIAVCLLGAWPAWRSTRISRRAEAPASSRLASALSASGGSVAAVTGIRFALEPGSRSRPIPTRSSLVGATTAVLVVVSVITFASSLDHLVGTPRLFGAPAARVVNFTSSDPVDPAPILVKIDRELAANPRVGGWTVISLNDLHIGGQTIPAVSMKPGIRPALPVILKGRAPRGRNEIALGESTIDALHTAVGRTVRVGPKRTPVKVVGTAVLPAIARYEGADKAGLGDGALLSPEAVDGLTGQNESESSPVLAVRTDLSSNELSKVVSKVLPGDVTAHPGLMPVPSDITALKALRATPVVLAALLVLLITATVIHAVVLAIRRRRGDVAVLQAMGMRPGQVVRSTLWQATTIASIAGVVGVPLGIIVGRWAWILLARTLGVFEQPVVPVLIIVAAGLLVLATANVVSLVPGWRSAHRHPGVALRTE
jgi:FtsX-like permease family